jgi:hypothetical protein
MIHHKTHWIAVALVAGLALLALEASGQHTGSTAMFEGRPSLAGAQAGLGAQAGPPQGGIGVEGTEAAQMNLRRPRIIDEPRDMPQGERVAVIEERVLPPKLDRSVTPAEARTIARQTP